MLMRPKSIATVVVVFWSIFDVSSTPSEAVVMLASVRSGSISEQLPTKVVLPTPKPPATTILADIGLSISELFDTGNNPLDEADTRIGCSVDSSM